MRVMQAHWSVKKGWLKPVAELDKGSAQLILIFGGTDALERFPLQDLRTRYPEADIVGCSTSGEIIGTEVFDDSVAVSAVTFEQTRLHIASETISGPEQSRSAGAALATKLAGDDLRHVFVLSDGLHVNGTALIEGMQETLPESVVITGGMSGDGARFARTLVVGNSEPRERQVVAVGLYGDRIRVGYGSLGGWEAFGPDRLITRSEGNVLYELDGEPALGVYKRYLGERADGLPSSGLLFPLSLQSEKGVEGLVRTILAVDEEAGTMTFAGDMPEGGYARLMKANFERLIDGACSAAESAKSTLVDTSAQLAVLISCVGRKLVLKQRIEEEVEGVHDVLGAVPMTGFYSYGEFSPYKPTAQCELHNQTMTITVFAEK